MNAATEKQAKDARGGARFHMTLELVDPTALNLTTGSEPRLPVNRDNASKRTVLDGRFYFLIDEGKES